MSSVADKLVSRMYDIVKNDESKRLLKEQQDRFTTEISIIMEALQECFWFFFSVVHVVD